MTEQRLEELLERLVRKVGLAEPDVDALALLEDELRDAENELALYLDWPAEEVAEQLAGKVVELAALFWRRDSLNETGLVSCAYSEGQVSQSERYQSPDQLGQAVEELLRGLARYRRVTC